MSDVTMFKLDDISFEITETKESDFTSGDSGFVFYLKIHNYGKKTKKISFKSISYVKKDKEQIEFTCFLNTLLAREGSIKSDSFKLAGLIFVKPQLSKIQLGDSLFVELIDEQLGIHYDMKFCYKKKQSSFQWFAQEIDSREVEKSITPAQVQSRLKKNLQRLEPLEERLGIYFDNISVKVNSEYNITVLGEVFASNGSTINESVDITLIVYDVEGNVIETQTKVIYSNDFYGFDVFELVIYENDIGLKADKLRLFPKKH